jgi:FdhE protein
VSSPSAAPDGVRLLDPALRFEVRARRLLRLAEDHPAEDWLRLLARIAEGQRAAVREVTVPAVRAAGEGPPLAFDRIPRDPTWRRMLAEVLASADSTDLPAAARGAISRLDGVDVARLEALADLQLAGVTPPGELGTAPFIGAALQAWFGALAVRLEPMAAASATGACPVCGAQPVAGVIDGSTRLRYLVCGLCGAEWNVPRLTCVACDEDAKLVYFNVVGDEGVQAEACEGCRGYVKLFDLAKQAEVEPVADDAATLALDLLMAEEGFRRVGPSPLLAVAQSD